MEHLKIGPLLYFLTLFDFVLILANYFSFSLLHLFPFSFPFSFVLFFFSFIVGRVNSHAPTCLRMEMWNNDTGKLLCASNPIYGGTGQIDVAKFDEPGYIGTHSSPSSRREKEKNKNFLKIAFF